MGDEVKNKSGEAVKLSKKKLELKPSNALNGKSLGEKSAPSDKKTPSGEIKTVENKSGSGQIQSVAKPAETKSAIPSEPAEKANPEVRHMAPPLPVSEEIPVPAFEPEVQATSDSNQGETQSQAADSNPWVSWLSWKRLLWGVFKTAVFLIVVVSAIIFGTVLGVTVYRTYFAIPDEIEVPAIEGKDFAVANELLKKAGLRLRIEEGRHNTKFPDRIIISQDPPKGRVVRQNREILAVVSLGPEQFKVPDLKGLSLREVKKSLNNNKLSLGKITYTPKNANRPDEVLEQKPLAGTLALKGTKVNIVVNKGLGMAKVSVPDCSGRTISRVVPVLKKAGLNLGKVIWSISDKPAGEVLSQNPPSGAAVMSDSEIALEVSAGSSTNRVLVHHKLEIFLPGGSEPNEVRVVVLSPEGEEEVYRASHVVNDVIHLWVTGTKGSDAEVYVNDKLFMRDKL